MRILTVCLFVVMCYVVSRCGAEPLRVDLDPDNDRADALTPGWESWRVDTGEHTNSRQFGKVTITLTAAGAIDAELREEWWKGGYDTGATLTSDGVVATGVMEIRISGLAPGKHAVATWHNVTSRWDTEKLPSYSVSVADTPVSKSAKVTWRVADDTDALTTYTTVTAEPDRDVVLRVVADAKDRPVYLNAFAIDVPDPATLVRKPVPSDGDEHTPPDPLLRWTAPTGGADAYDVYFGKDEKTVETATPGSLTYRGRQTVTEFATNGLNTNDSYYWRVDAIHVKAEPAIAKGAVWSFRMRHLAFPGAEGYGRFARGGRGGRVLAVTNLNDAGPGSLREAVEAEGPRTVVFRVGGTIQLKSRLIVKNPYLTVAGQTAPGDGICARGYSFGTYATHDVILRYLRIRLGDESGLTMDGSGMGVKTDHSIMDHCSISWSIDEAFSSRQARNITFQNNLIAEALNMSVHAHYVGTGKGHSFAGSVSGDIASLHHNLIAHCAGRNWSLAGGLTGAATYDGFLDIRNNVVYNWVHRTNDGGAKAVNIVGNYYIPGPASRVAHLLVPDTGSAQDPQQYYVADNVMEGMDAINTDNWAASGVVIDQKLIPRIRLIKPFCEPFITVQTAADAYTRVIEDAGAILPHRDAVDERVVRDVVNRSFTYRGSKTGLPGIIDTQKDSGGWPALKSGDAPTDTDSDGMPDAWERAQQLNPADSADGNVDPTGGGYTNLERYLQWIIEKSGKLCP